MRNVRIFPSASALMATGCLLLTAPTFGADGFSRSDISAIQLTPAPATAATAARPGVAAPAEEVASASEMSVESNIMGVQRGLTLLGYDPGPVDGIMGSKTRGAITAYQEDHGLETTGEASQALYDRLFAETSVPPREDEPLQQTATTTAETVPDAAPAVVVNTMAPPAPAPDLWQSRDDMESYSPLETAIVSFFDFVRDSTLFLVSQFTGDEHIEDHALEEQVAETTASPESTVTLTSAVVNK